MYRHLIRTIMVFLFAVFFLISQVASGQAQYAPPTTVTLTMYQLNQDQGGASTGIPCKEGDRTYGCTADPDNEDFAYPFGSSTITLSIDGNLIVDPDNDGNLIEDNIYDPAQRYPWDVAAQEIGLEGSNGVKPLAGVKAQAIASKIVQVGLG